MGPPLIQWYGTGSRAIKVNGQFLPGLEADRAFETPAVWARLIGFAG
jgi:hypothetical protein